MPFTSTSTVVSPSTPTLIYTAADDDEEIWVVGTIANTGGEILLGGNSTTQDFVLYVPTGTGTAPPPVSLNARVRAGDTLYANVNSSSGPSATLTVLVRSA